MNKTENYLKRLIIIKPDEKFKERLKNKLKETLCEEKNNAAISFEKKLAFANICMTILIAAMISLQIFSPKINYTQQASLTSESPVINGATDDLTAQIYSSQYTKIMTNKTDGINFVDKNKILKEILKEG